MTNRRLALPRSFRGCVAGAAVSTLLLTALGACASSTTSPTATVGDPVSPTSTPLAASASPPDTTPDTTPATGARTTGTGTGTGTGTTGPQASDAGGASPSSDMNPAADSVYAGAAAGHLSAAVADAKPYVYVPSNDAGTVTVIDQATMQVVETYRVGKLAQHVVPSWDLKTLYAAASGANQLVPIDPSTGKPGAPIKVDAPYNLYFTPDGSTAIVMAERLGRMDFYDRQTWTLLRSTKTGSCHGVNHADWSADGSFFVATCEFSGDVIKVDTASGAILGRLALPRGAMPQDLRLAPDGHKFYVADMQHAGLWVLSEDGTAVTGFIATGVGTHGIYPSRDSRVMYITNRGRTKNDEGRRSRDGDGSISVVDPATDTVIATWTIPGGGSPDMGGVSADGTRLWVSGRYDSVVYVFDTSTGAVVGKIPVPKGPHGLCVFPQPGSYSLGHTGNFR